MCVCPAVFSFARSKLPREIHVLSYFSSPPLRGEVSARGKVGKREQQHRTHKQKPMMCYVLDGCVCVCVCVSAAMFSLAKSTKYTYLLLEGGGEGRIRKDMDLL